MKKEYKKPLMVIDYYDEKQEEKQIILSYSPERSEKIDNSIKDSIKKLKNFTLSLALAHDFDEDYNFYTSFIVFEIQNKTKVFIQKYFVSETDYRFNKFSNKNYEVQDLDEFYEYLINKLQTLSDSFILQNQ